MMLQLPREIIQAIHDYLVTRPMIEVEALVAEIRKAKPAKPDEDA